MHEDVLFESKAHRGYFPNSGSSKLIRFIVVKGRSIN
jgi:hypothetical protein